MAQLADVKAKVRPPTWKYVADVSLYGESPVLSKVEG
jgi:hypothetical protein